MNFEEIWAKNAHENASGPSRKDLQAMMKHQGHGLIGKLRRQLRIKLYFGLFGILICAFAILYVWGNGPWVITIGTFIFMTILLCAVIYRQYLKLPDLIDMDQPTLPLFKEYYKKVKRILWLEERIGAIFIIPSPALGGILGMSAGAELPIGELLEKPVTWAVLVALAVVIGPLAVWLSVWMNKIAFGGYLEQLKEKIDALASI